MDASGSFHEKQAIWFALIKWRQVMKEWLKPEITESEAGMEVTSYLPAELDRA
jgi:coenzyme PQQ precursor peptide PqqA